MFNEQSAALYAKDKGFFDKNAELVCKEIGDGNINYVYRVFEPASEKSVIIKQADRLLRSSQRPLSVDRIRLEAEYLLNAYKYAPDFVPRVYLYDPVLHCIIMQDLSEYENMRHALLSRKTFQTFADDISTFMAETLLRTTDHFLDPMEKKELCKSMINPEMCLISEKLVFIDPYTNHFGTNILFEENEGFFNEEIYNNAELNFEAAKLYEKFKSNAQALIHGDLHTGSIFVKPGSTMVLDSEFAFYGPIGYDVGNVIANLIFTWVNAFVSDDGDDTFINWVESTIEKAVDLFHEKALNLLKNKAVDRMAQTPRFADWYLNGIMRDAMGYAGTELIRRVIGDAKVVDIAGITDRQKRAAAEKICVMCAKKYILDTKNHPTGEDFIWILHHLKKLY